ncbi:MAG: exopolysaccharide biosynthesis protein [Chlamydiae bacterium]|nr:exopolysaccharide biosynthesis protein [Chlamydiota bacterium]
MHENMKSLEKKLRALQKRQDPLAIRDIVEIFSEQGMPLLLILLGLPFCQPLQIPGISIPFGLAIACIGLQMIRRKRLWLPKFLLEREISARGVQKLVRVTLWWLRKMHKWIRPRWTPVFTYQAKDFVHGLIIFSLGVFLSIPLPIPFSNLIAAWSIVLIALGVLEEDGLILVLGYTMLGILACGAFLLMWTAQLVMAFF